MSNRESSVNYEAEPISPLAAAISLAVALDMMSGGRLYEAVLVIDELMSALMDDATAEELVALQAEAERATLH